MSSTNSGQATARAIAYRALASTLRSALSRGEFVNGRPLPTEAELSRTHQVSRQTVRRALQELVAEGLVYRVRGRGTFGTGISPGHRYLRSFGSVNDLLAYSVDTILETVEPLERRTDVEAASRLRLDSDEVFGSIIRRVHEDRPFSATCLALPPDLGSEVVKRGHLLQAGEKSPITVISLIDEVAPNPIAGAQQSITAVALPERIAELVGARTGVAGLRIDRLYYDTLSRPVELAVTHFNPDRYSYRIELSRGPDHGHA